MRSILIIIISIIVACSILVIFDKSFAGGIYINPETLQNRIDYYNRIIWDLENRYKTKDYRRMYPRDRSRYIKTLQQRSAAIQQYNNLIQKRQYKQQRNYYRKY